MATQPRKKHRKKSSRRKDRGESSRGGMASIRAGFQNLVGTGKAARSSKGTNFLWFLLLVAALILFIVSLTR